MKSSKSPSGLLDESLMGAEVNDCVQRDSGLEIKAVDSVVEHNYSCDLEAVHLLFH